jgi:hypothetical protein
MTRDPKALLTLLVDVLLVNQTAETLQNLCLDFSTLGDLKLVERPSVHTVAPQSFLTVKASIKVLNIFPLPGQITHKRIGVFHWDWRHIRQHLMGRWWFYGSLRYFERYAHRYYGLYPTGFMQRNSGSLHGSEFGDRTHRSTSSEACGLNLSGRTGLTYPQRPRKKHHYNVMPLTLYFLSSDLHEYLRHIMKSTNMGCLTPDAAISGECDYLSANLCARSVFGKAPQSPFVLMLNTVYFRRRGCTRQREPRKDWGRLHCGTCSNPQQNTGHCFVVGR